MTAKNLTRMAFAGFSGPNQVNSRNLRDRILALQAANNFSATPYLPFSAEALDKLQQMSLNDLPQTDRELINNSKTEVICFGHVGESITIYLFEKAQGSLIPLLHTKMMSGVPGVPESLEAWKMLPTKPRTGMGMRAQVWTEKNEYRVGQNVTFNVRCNQDGYLVLLDLQTSGGLYVVYPNRYQLKHHVKAGEIYSVPSNSSAFDLVAQGPAGVEGIKAIVSRKPIEWGSLNQDSVFISAKSTAAQRSLTDAIKKSLTELGNDDWDVAEWTFQITE